MDISECKLGLPVRHRYRKLEGIIISRLTRNRFRTINDGMDRYDVHVIDTYGDCYIIFLENLEIKQR